MLCSQLSSNSEVRGPPVYAVPLSRRTCYPPSSKFVSAALPVSFLNICFICVLHQKVTPNVLHGDLDSRQPVHSLGPFGSSPEKLLVKRGGGDQTFPR